jgi:TorA maturation chaperone TorD
MQAGLTYLKEWSRMTRVEMSDEVFDALKSDYTRLFIGPGQVLAPPWESVFVKEGRMIFQESTLRVREWYLRYDLEPVSLYKEPDDHIGLELLFLAHLAGLSLAALRKQDEAEFTATIEAQRGFLSEHVLTWASIWCDQVGVYCRTDFFRGIALTVRGALAELADIFALESPVFVKP